MYCPNCGFPIKEGNIFCGNCGFDLSKVVLDEQELENKFGKPAKKGKHINWIILISVILLLVIFIGLVLFFEFPFSFSDISDSFKLPAWFPFKTEVSIASEPIPTETEILPVQEQTPKSEPEANETITPTATLKNSPQPDFVNPPAENEGIKTSTPEKVNIPITCPGAPSTRMEIGMKARVTFRNNSALALRNQPSLSKSSFIKDLSEGTKFTVIGGPECYFSFTWWKIETKAGAVGWSAEGNEKEYYMQPYNW